MSGRDNLVATYLTDEELATLDQWADDAGKSRSSLVRDAVLEFLDHDRVARIEDQLDDIREDIERVAGEGSADTAHTHKDDTPMNTATKSTERARDIVRRLQANHDEVMKNDVVDRAIEDIAGIDDRTKRKYKRLFRKRGLLFEHPGQPPLWTTDADTWLDWMKDYMQLNGREKADEVADQYPARIVPGGNGVRIELTEDTNA